MPLFSVPAAGTRLRRGGAALLATLALLAPRPGAAQLPFGDGASQREQNTQWMRAQREQAVLLLQDWANLSDRGLTDEMIRYLTDSAILVDGETVAVGRGPAGELLRSRSGERLRWATLGHVAPGSRLISAGGRMVFRDAQDVERMSDYTAVLERHHGRWLIRMLALSPSSTAPGAVPRDAVTPDGRRAHPPERLLVRLVAEPFYMQERTAGSLSTAGPVREAGWETWGGGLGLEWGRAFELRGFYWRDRTSDVEPTSAYGAEARIHLFELWRLRPHLSVGGERMRGAFAPDSSWAPVAGGGLGMRLNETLDLQLFARDHMSLQTGADDGGFWATRPRDHRWTMGAGLSVSLGRRARWSDAKPSESQRAYALAEWPAAQSTLDVLATAVRTGDEAGVRGAYAPAAELMDARGARYHGSAAIHDFWSGLRATGAPAVSAQNATVSGNVAYADVVVSGLEGDAPLVLFTVLERFGGEWRIRAQVATDGGAPAR